jgi:hypothetical protein
VLRRCRCCAAAHAQGWWLYAALVGVMLLIFGAIPFTDAMVCATSTTACARAWPACALAVSFGVSSLAVWLLGPFVKAAGFQTLFVTMAGIALLTVAAVLALPRPSVPANAAGR